MEHFVTQIPSWFVTAIIGLVGVGIGWGFFKSEVAHLKEQSKIDRDKIDRLSTSRPDLQLRADCITFRQSCRDDMDSKFSEIKSAIDKNREVVTEQFDEVREFMGYVRRALEDMNGKS